MTTADPARPLEPGVRIGGYILERTLGRGGMGAVYRARHAQTGAVHALKVVRPDLEPAEAAFATERFAREMELLARVDDHPGIVRARASGVERGLCWYSMDHVEGEALQRLVDAPERDPRRAAEVVAAVARAVHHAHRAGVVHRDLKPANVLLAQDGSPRVLDFGLAFAAGAARLTRTGEALGTPGYMAPEQLAPLLDGAARATITPRTDVYALGAILYALLVGHAPYVGPVRAILVAVSTGEPPPPRARDPEVPEPLDRICRRAMASDPADRHASAAALADDLDRWLRTGEAGARPPGSVARMWRRARARPLRTLGPIGLGAGLLVAAALVARGLGDPPAKRLEAVEGQLRAGSPLTAAQRDEVRSLARAGPDALRARFDLLAIADRAAALGEGAELDAAVADIAARVREPDGQELLAPAQRVLAGLRRLDLVHRVLHEHEPVLCAHPDLAADLAREVVRSARPVPTDAAAFDVLLRALGRDDEPVRGTLQLGHGLALLGRGETERALDALLRAHDEHRRIPPAGTATEALQDTVVARVPGLIERADDALPRAWALTRILSAATDGDPTRLPARLRERAHVVLYEAGRKLADDADHREASPALRRFVRYSVFLAPYGESAIRDWMLHRMLDANGRDARWISEGAGALGAEPRERRNAPHLMLHARFILVAHRRRMLPPERVEPLLRAAEGWIESAAASRLAADFPRWFALARAECADLQDDPERALRFALAALELDRRLEPPRRWPRIGVVAATAAMHLAAEEPARALEAAALILEAAAIQDRRDPSLELVSDAEERGELLHRRTRIAELVARRPGPPRCCGEVGVARLLEGVREAAAGCRPDLRFAVTRAEAWHDTVHGRLERARGALDDDIDALRRDVGSGIHEGLDAWYHAEHLAQALRARAEVLRQLDEGPAAARDVEEADRVAAERGSPW